MPRIRPQFSRNRHPRMYSNFLNGIRNNSTQSGNLEMRSNLEWERVFTCRKRTIMKKALELNNLTNSVVSVYIKSPSGEVWFYASDDVTKQSLQKCGLINKNSMRVTSDSLQNKMVTGDKINDCDVEEKPDENSNLSNTHSESNRNNNVNGNSSHQNLQKDDDTANTQTQRNSNKPNHLSNNKVPRNITSTPLYKPRNANLPHSNRQQVSTPNVSLIPPPTYEHAMNETQTCTTILSPEQSPAKITEELDEDVIAISNIQDAIDLTSSPESQSSIEFNEDIALGDNVNGDTIVESESLLTTKTHPNSMHNDSASCDDDDNKSENQFSDISVKLENPYANDKNWNFVSEASDSDSSDGTTISQTPNNVKNDEEKSSKVQKSSLPKRAKPIHCENNSKSNNHNVWYNSNRSKSSLQKPPTRTETSHPSYSHGKHCRTNHRRDENRYKFQRSRSNQNCSRPREPRRRPSYRSEQGLQDNRRQRKVYNGLHEHNSHHYTSRTPSTEFRHFQYHQDRYTIRRHRYPTYPGHYRYNKDNKSNH